MKCFGRVTRARTLLRRILIAVVPTACAPAEAAPDPPIVAVGDADVPEVQSPPDAPQAPTHRTPIAGWEGRLMTWDMKSTITGIASRTLTVLVPPGYDIDTTAHYPVLYMQDGQNCLAHDGFGHGGWQMHTVLYDLIARGRMAKVIVAMVDSSKERNAEFIPEFSGGSKADAYLNFLERDIIPFVDANFRTVADAPHRALGGSSFGALISLYGSWTRPTVYARIMAMSPAYAYNFQALVKERKTLRIYLDSGTTFDGASGDDSRTRTEFLRNVLVEKGWQLNVDLKHYVGIGHQHNEEFWRARLPVALPFVFPASQ